MRSRPINNLLKRRLKLVLRIALIPVLVLAIAIILYVPILTVLNLATLSENYTYAIGKASSILWEHLLIVLIGFILISAITLLFPNLPDFIFYPLLIPLVGFGLYGVALSISPLLELSPNRTLTILHAEFVKPEETNILAAAGRLAMPDRIVAMEDSENVKTSLGTSTFIMTRDNVLAIGNGYGHSYERFLVFKEAIKSLEDFIAVPGMILVISGKMLRRSGANGDSEPVSELPGEHFRFGQQVIKEGLLSSFLLFGHVKDGWAVYELNPNGTYTKVVQSDLPITSAVGCYEGIALASGNTLMLAAPGRDLTFLVELPGGVGPITSVSASSFKNEKEAKQCTYYVATKDRVFGLENGYLYLLATGIGGELRVNDWMGDLLVMDSRRHAIFKLSFHNRSEA